MDLYNNPKDELRFCGRYDMSETLARLGSRYRIDVGQLDFAPNTDVRADEAEFLPFFPAWRCASEYEQPRQLSYIARKFQPTPLTYGRRIRIRARDIGHSLPPCRPCRTCS
jgi:hypothetical protein